MFYINGLLIWRGRDGRAGRRVFDEVIVQSVLLRILSGVEYFCMRT